VNRAVANLKNSLPGIQIHAIHIEGTLNVIPDALSRGLKFADTAVDAQARLMRAQFADE
jgi:hypothetical protein